MRRRVGLQHRGRCHLQREYDDEHRHPLRRYGSGARAALLCPAPPSPAQPRTPARRARRRVELHVQSSVEPASRPASWPAPPRASLPRPCARSLPRPSALGHCTLPPCALRPCNLAETASVRVGSHSWLCVRACVRACVRRKVREAPYVRLGGWVASQSEERAILGILTRRVFQAAPAPALPTTSAAAPRPSPTAVATARAAPPSWSTAAWRRRSCKRASTFLLSFTIHLRGRESNRCQQRCTKGSAQGLVMCVCFV